MVQRLDSGDSGFAQAFDALVMARGEAVEDVDDVVAGIIADVRARGDAALCEYTARFDGFEVAGAAQLAVGADRIGQARAACSNEQIAALELAAGRIEDYHRRQLPENLDYTDDDGIRLGARYSAIEAVGLYVPGGTAAYPSTVLMNAVPARVAGVSRLVMVVPAKGGELNPLVLAAAGIAGIEEIYRVGGAQAVAALAYGTETIRAVDKIVGPGNAYVACAKRRVFGIVGIDMIAGPSEVLVVADAANDAAWIAADLMSQAEHDADAQAVLIADDAGFADAVTAAVEDCLGGMTRADIARRSWRDHGAVIVVGGLDEAVPLIDRLAPEHLQLAVADPDALANAVRNAGAIFLGRYMPEALGDYVAGPSHVLPTSRSARFSSGLGVMDFLKRTSLMGCDEAGLARIGPAARVLARAEGLDTHALSLSLRLDALDKT